MDLQHPPESFGVFKPVGCIVITLRTERDLQTMSDALSKAGFAASEQLRYSSADMLAQVDAETQQASVWAQFGQELRIAKAHRMLATRGCSFLVVRATGDEQVAQVSALVRQLHAPTAQRYGHLIIEELTGCTASEVRFEDVPPASMSASSSPGDVPIDAALPPTR